MPDTEDIKYQTRSIHSQIEQNTDSSHTYQAKTNYQMEMYSAVKYVNQLFLLFYIILFTVIHVLFLQQYIQGVKRDEIKDSIWLTFFFLYPYLIYYVERILYFCVTYPLALIYGQSYVFQFDRLMLFNEYYEPADPTNKNVLSV